MTTAAAATFAYDSTLAKHHSWFLRKTAHMGTYLLPSRDSFLKDIRFNGSLDLARNVTKNGQKIYEITKRIYEEKNLWHIAY